MRLIFVYNADSTFFAKLMDYVHKMVSPNTYQCNLCAITYDNLGMKKEWKEFIDSLSVESEFLHKDEFVKKYSFASHSQLPAVFIKDNNQIKELITASEIKNEQTLDDLKKIVLSKIERFLQPTK